MINYLTLAMIFAAGRDAGNRSMQKAGRSKWSKRDYNAACAEFNRLEPFVNCNYTVEAARYELATREGRENAYAESMIRKDQRKRLTGHA